MVCKVSKRSGLPAHQVAKLKPIPYHAGNVCRDCAQANTQPIARTEFLERSCFFRCEGREPILSWPISPTGVAS